MISMWRTIKRVTAIIFITSVILMVVKPQASMRNLVTYNEEAEDITSWQETFERRAKGPLTYGDPNLLRLLREKYLIPPSDEKLNLMLEKTGEEADNYNIYRIAFGSWERINGILKNLFADQPSGIFLEAGALDGEFISNTLYLEQELGWTGLLVEADPILFGALPGKHRRAWSSQSCISPAAYAQSLILETYRPRNRTDLASELMVRSTGNLQGVDAPAKGQMGLKMPYQVQCFPLVSYLLALNFTKIQYISLDVEGAEADILLTLPWEQVDVIVWTIEHRSQNKGFRDFYLEPGGVKPPPKAKKDLQRFSKSGKPLPPRKVVYITQHDPAGGKDDYFVLFMKEKGYTLYDYWDGDYTFIKSNSDICERHCKVV